MVTPDMASDAAPVRLLHLSDFHFSGGTDWDADPVLRDLADAIGRDVTERGLAPDLVVITGDLAQAGKAADYELARRWLAERLWPVLTTDPASPLPRDHLLLVPGNHDVDRDRVSEGAKDSHEALLRGADQKEVTKRLEHATTRTLLLERHSAYLAFYAAWLGLGSDQQQDQPLPWWQRRFDDLHGQRLHIAGLDSAWLAHQHDDARLILGTWQINQTARHADAGHDGDYDWRIALLHHPWASLAEFDRTVAERTLHRHRDLILRGHLHRPHVVRSIPIDDRQQCIEAAAGCCYSGSDYPNAFHWIELFQYPRQVRFHFRSWNEGTDWDLDMNKARNQQGIHTIDIPGGRTARGPGADPPRPAPTPTPDVTQPSAAVRDRAKREIALRLKAYPPLASALTESEPPPPGGTPAALADWLCPPAADALRARMSALRTSLTRALQQARQGQGDLLALREAARDLLAWMTVATVLDAYTAQTAPGVAAWFDGVAYRIPLSPGPCPELLAAAWAERKPLLQRPASHWDYGPYTLTAHPQADPGTDSVLTLDTTAAVHYVRRLVWRHIEKVGEPPLLIDGDDWHRLRGRLRIKRDEKGEQRRLVLDGRAAGAFDHAAVLRAISADLPEVYLIVLVGGGSAGGPAIFLLPPPDLAAEIEECLEDLEACQ